MKILIGYNNKHGPYGGSYAGFRAGLRRLHELWDVDAHALEQSDPIEIALAVRALSKSGPPHMY